MGEADTGETMMIQTCKTCAYSFAHKQNGAAESTLHCHRYAPRATEDRWPKVEFSEWCGEYVERCGYDRAV